MSYKKILSIFFLSTLIVPFLNYKIASASLTNSLVISDSVFAKIDSVSNVDDINNFLRDQGSWLYNYVIPQDIIVQYPLSGGGFGEVSAPQSYNGANFFNKTVAQLIFEETREHGVNPYVILAMLEKESNAITRNSPSSRTTEAWPLFYMYDETMGNCLNSGGRDNCNNDAYRDVSINFGGVGQQIAYSTAWLGKKFTEYSTTGRPLKNSNNQIIGYEQYNEPVNIDGNSVICESKGTRILYLYTPHLQTNFYNIFSNWFGDPATGQVTPPTISQRLIPGDTNEDQHVNSTDLSVLAGTWDQNVPANTGADFSGDGLVNSTDLSILAGNWGK